MKTKKLQSGISLIEAVLAIAVVILLVSVSIPAYKAFDTAINSPAGTESMLSAALSSARAIAAKHQKYAGIRFQQDKNGNQYMIPIIHAEPANMGNLTIAYTAIEGKNPVKMPQAVGVMDLKYGSSDISSNSELDDSEKVADTTTFSVIFSPSGSLVITDVRTRNIDGLSNPSYDDISGNSDTYDSVFNGFDAVTKGGIGLFVQDDYPTDGYGEEKSRSSFIIYNKEDFDNTIDKWDDYVEDLEVHYINPYTGTIINN